jgi:hypothetical protein
MSSMNELENITYRRLGILLIATGVLCAVASYFGLPLVYKLWPALVLSTGIGFIGIYVKRRGRGSQYLVVGEYFVLFSGLAFYCNFTSWGELTELWPIFMTFLSVVFATLYFTRRRRRFMLFLSFFFLVASVLAFLVFSFDGQYWWSVFFLLGLGVLLTGKSK